MDEWQTYKGFLVTHSAAIVSFAALMNVQMFLMFLETFFFKRWRLTIFVFLTNSILICVNTLGMLYLQLWPFHKLYLLEGFLLFSLADYKMAAPLDHTKRLLENSVLRN